MTPGVIFSQILTTSSGWSSQIKLTPYEKGPIKTVAGWFLCNVGRFLLLFEMSVDFFLNRGPTVPARVIGDARFQVARLLAQRRIFRYIVSMYSLSLGLLP